MTELRNSWTAAKETAADKGDPNNADSPPVQTVFVFSHRSMSDICQRPHIAAVTGNRHANTLDRSCCTLLVLLQFVWMWHSVTLCHWCLYLFELHYTELTNILWYKSVFFPQSDLYLHQIFLRIDYQHLNSIPVILYADWMQRIALTGLVHATCHFFNVSQWAAPPIPAAPFSASNEHDDFMTLKNGSDYIIICIII